ncbi:MAG: plasmid pRiA4b ORF-3 family protein [Chloroflexi bacterium]|nr:plasmid pRiA4b ORF-3 family protein [Chloroflexota bacterium]
MVTKRPATSDIYQLKVTLKGIKPPIWRRIQVRSDITLYKLHKVLQVVMGWTDSHLHQFIIEGRYYGEPDPDFGWEKTVNEKRVRLPQVIHHERSKFAYEYDFGDGWMHEILVEKILEPEPGKQYPLCLAGRRSAPPEDCGGTWGYEHFLEVIGNRNDPEHEEMLEWVGGDFDPEAFDISGINQGLKELG